MRVAIQGELGSFHHMAAVDWYGPDIEIVACETFKAVFETVKNKQAETAIVAIENSLFGSINEVYDLLLAYKIPITGEVPLRVEQCLIGNAHTSLRTITHVHSHPVALAQCSDFLDDSLPHAERIENHDTASSVALVMASEDNSLAAIASPLAAGLHDATIIKKNIENHDANYTRFLVLDPKAQSLKKPTKASLVIQTNHKAGSLYGALGVFAEAGINLTKLQSRPIVGRIWKYMFYVDIELENQDVQQTLDTLNALGCTVTLLGLYQRAN